MRRFWNDILSRCDMCDMPSSIVETAFDHCSFEKKKKQTPFGWPSSPARQATLATPRQSSMAAWMLQVMGSAD